MTSVYIDTSKAQHSTAHWYSLSPHAVVSQIANLQQKGNGSNNNATGSTEIMNLYGLEE